MYIDTGLYLYRISGLSESIKTELKALYPEATQETSDEIPHFTILIKNTSLIRRLLRPQVAILIEGYQAFNPIAPKKLLPSIEWAMNWCVAAYDHTHLLIHCGVIVKDDKAILFPAKSGSGKSTTATFLGLNGWTLYSDEMAVIDINTGFVKPVFRPSSLKNESIDIIKPYIGTNHYLSVTTHETHKGSIAHVRSNNRVTFDSLTPCKIAAIVFLDFDNTQPHVVYEVSQAVGFAKLVKNAFNYSVIGELAFEVLSSVIDDAICVETTYSDMHDINSLANILISAEAYD